MVEFRHAGVTGSASETRINLEASGCHWQWQSETGSATRVIYSAEHCIV